MNLASKTNIEEKICSQCHEKYPASTEYYRPDKKSGDGLRSNCRTCDSVKRRTRKKRDVKPMSVTKKSDGIGDVKVTESVTVSQNSVTKSRLNKRNITLGLFVFLVYSVSGFQSTFSGSFLFRHGFLIWAGDGLVTELLSMVCAGAFVTLSALLWYAATWAKNRRWLFVLFAVIVQIIQFGLYWGAVGERLSAYDTKQIEQINNGRQERIRKQIEFYEGEVRKYLHNKRYTDRAWQDYLNNKKEVSRLYSELNNYDKPEPKEPDLIKRIGILIAPELAIILCPLLLVFVREEI